MIDLLEKIDSFVWGLPTIVLLAGTGVFITGLLKVIQLRHVAYAWKLISGKYDNPEDEGEVTHFQALSTALSATIGTGTIAGAGTAVAIGGPGAIFWMWVTAVFGMGLKYAECLLSLNFRKVHSDGTTGGGPMYPWSMAWGKNGWGWPLPPLLRLASATWFRPTPWPNPCWTPSACPTRSV